MTTRPDRATALMDGPPARAPERITETTVLAGRRVTVNAEDGTWVRDLRAIDNAYWYDETTYKRWLPGAPVPADGDPTRARLFVSVCTERDWYEWSRTKRRPEVREYPAYLVWAE